MNNFCGIGRLTKDPELKYTANNLAIAKFTIAIERSFQKKDEEKKVDFLNCTVFGAVAEKFVAVYFKKGMRIGVRGEVHIEKYIKDDKTSYFTDILCDKVFFADGKSNMEPQQNNNQGDGFYPVSDDDSEFPF